MEETKRVLYHPLEKGYRYRFGSNGVTVSVCTTQQHLPATLWHEPLADALCTQIYLGFRDFWLAEIDGSIDFHVCPASSPASTDADGDAASASTAAAPPAAGGGGDGAVKPPPAPAPSPPADAAAPAASDTKANDDASASDGSITLKLSGNGPHGGIVLHFVANDLGIRGEKGTRIPRLKVMGGEQEALLVWRRAQLSCRLTQRLHPILNFVGDRWKSWTFLWSFLFKCLSLSTARREPGRWVMTTS